MTKLEQVAESQAKFDGRSLAGMPKGERGRYIERARLAIEAMREPTEEMIDAGDDIVSGGANYAPDRPLPTLRNAYSAMIDAALKEPTC